MEAPTTETGQKMTVVLVSKAGSTWPGHAVARNSAGRTSSDRAISLYEFLDQERDAGAELLLRRRDGSTYLVELLN